MTAIDRYSLWLVPEGAGADALQSVIDRLAGEHGGPSFPPHVTLFGSLESTEDGVVARSGRLAGQIAPFTVHLDDLAVGDTYFQSLFATVQATPELLAAREAAQSTFPEVPDLPFMPHLSLLYGKYPPETKQAIVEALRGTVPTSFAARLLVVIRTGRSIEDWRDVLRAKLTGSAGC